MRQMIMIRSLLLIIALSIYSMVSLFGQDITITKNGEVEKIYFDRSEACDKELVFMVVEQMPQYKGGIEQLEKDLNEQVSVEKKMKGKFRFRCTINCKGIVFGFEEMNNQKSEVVEKIKNQLIKLQNWEAGKQRGASIDCFYSFKVKIKNKKIKLGH